MRRHRVFYGNYYDTMRLDTVGLPRPELSQPKREKETFWSLLREIRDLLKLFVSKK